MILPSFFQHHCGFFASVTQGFFEYLSIYFLISGFDREFHLRNQKFRFQRRPFLRLLLQKYIFRENFVVSLKSSSVFFVFSLSIISKRPAVRRFGTKKEVYWLFWRILVLKEVQDVASRLRDYLSDNFRKFGSVPKIQKFLRTCSRMNPSLIKTDQQKSLYQI